MQSIIIVFHHVETEFVTTSHCRATTNVAQKLCGAERADYHKHESSGGVRKHGTTKLPICTRAKTIISAVSGAGHDCGATCDDERSAKEDLPGHSDTENRQSA